MKSPEKCEKAGGHNITSLPSELEFVTDLSQGHALRSAQRLPLATLCCAFGPYNHALELAHGIDDAVELAGGEFGEHRQGENFVREFLCNWKGSAP